jgi:hypothetical protein
MGKIFDGKITITHLVAPDFETYNDGGEAYVIAHAKKGYGLYERLIQVWFSREKAREFNLFNVKRTETGETKEPIVTKIHGEWKSYTGHDEGGYFYRQFYVLVA